MLDAALEYLAAGLRPIPVITRNKMPAAAPADKPTTKQRPLRDWKEYQKRAPTEEELGKWFDGSVAFNMGTVIPPGVIILDFDGGKGAEALLAAQGVTLPMDTPRVRSGSGGYHAYLRLPPGMKDFAKIPGKNFLHAVDAQGQPCKPFVEVLTVNNFVVLPPSTHPNGKPYTWVVPLDGIPEAPSTLFACIARIQAAANGQTVASGPKPATGRKAKGTKANPDGWVEELSKGTGPGTHDDSMVKLAGHYLRKRLPVAQVIDIIDAGYGRRSWQVKGVPHRIPMADIKRVVESVARKEGRKSEVAQTEFQLLGYDHDKYYYLSRATGQVVELSARNHDKNNFLRIASLRYWENNYGSEHGIAWPAAQAKLMDAQHQVGIFDPERFRGRGAWWDEGIGAVMHTGAELLANGVATPIKTLPLGRYVYELSKPLDVTIGKPLDVEEAAKVLEIFDMLSWEHPHHSRLAAGWCVAAIVCGALKWRPHVWFSGPSGSGKSWTVDTLVRRLLGNLALGAQSETTEAGLRQTLGHDARPVIFDEAEAEGQRGDARMANVLGLIRQASSESGGSIIKGSANGAAQAYRIRSCFAMSSINVSAYQAADKNRITILEMQVPPVPEGMDASKWQVQRNTQFSAICAAVATTLNDRYVAAFRARCIAMIPVIRANAEVLAVAASSAIGSRRLGDQVGTLLACAYSLLDDDIMTPEHAVALLEDTDLTQQKELQAVNDEQELIDHIMQQVVRVPVTHGSVERTAARLAEVSQGEQDDVSSRDAADALALLGIKATSDGCVIANSHRGIKKILTETHWGKDWGRVLLRLPGAQRSGVVRMGAVACRGVMVPWRQVLR